MESFKDFGLKIGTHSCFNEYNVMMICEYKRLRSLFDLSLRTVIL